MISLRVAAVAAAGLAAALASPRAVAEEEPDRVSARVVASRTAIRPGESVELGVLVAPRPGFTLDAAEPSVVFEALEGLALAKGRRIDPDRSPAAGGTVILLAATASAELAEGTAALRGTLRLRVVDEDKAAHEVTQPVALDLPVAVSGTKTRLSHTEVFRPEVPAWSLEGLGGDELSSAKFRGKTLVMHLFKGSDPASAKPLPGLAELREDLGSRGLETVAIALDGTREAVQRILSEQKSGLLTALGTRDVVGRFEGLLGPLDTVPVQLVIDREGRIRSVREGAACTAAPRSQVESLLPPPPAATVVLVVEGMT